LTEKSVRFHNYMSENLKTKPEYQLNLPDGEFTMKDLVRQTGKKQPFLHIKLTKLLAAGKVTVIREERGHIGRAAKVYKKV
jgi:DNA-binding transcriptional ArsR family regulator